MTGALRIRLSFVIASTMYFARLILLMVIFGFGSLIVALDDLLILFWN